MAAESGQHPSGLAAATVRDEEEREAVPLIEAHISGSEWEAGSKTVQASLDRKKLPLVSGWLASASTPAHQEAAPREVPLIPRLMFRRLWGPAYARRFTALYGGHPAIPAPAA